MAIMTSIQLFSKATYDTGSEYNIHSHTNNKLIKASTHKYNKCNILKQEIYHFKLVWEQSPYDI